MSEPPGGGRQYSGGQNRQPQRLTPLVPPPAATMANVVPFPFQFDGGFQPFMMIPNQPRPLRQDLYHPNVMHPHHYPAMLSWSGGPQQVLAQTQDPFMQMRPARGPYGMMPTLPSSIYTMNPSQYAQLAPSSAQYPIQYHSSSPSPLPRLPAEAQVAKPSRKTMLPATTKPRSHKRAKEASGSEESEEEDEKEAPQKVVFVKRPALGGERRLAIKFDHLGELRFPLQTYGSQRSIVPHGIEGSHTSYNQDWWFRVTHESDARSGATVLVFEVVNIASGLKVVTRETPEQAASRQETGKTICNQAMQLAFKERCLELQHILETETMEEPRRSNVKALMNKLIAKNCTEGLLFFWLRHTAVQEHLEMSLKTHENDE